MWDIIEAIRKALNLESTWTFVLVIALGSGFVGGFAAWILDKGYRNSAEYRAEHIPKTEAVASEIPHPATANSTEEPARTPGHETTPASSHSGQPKPLTGMQERAIVKKIVGQYWSNHQTYPSLTFINQQLTKENRNFQLKSFTPTPSNCYPSFSLDRSHGAIAENNTAILAPGCAEGFSAKDSVDATLRGNIVQPKTETPSTPPSAPTMSQECAPGANCAMSNGQTGGITAGTVNLGLPERHLTQEQKEAFVAWADSLSEPNKRIALEVLAASTGEAQAFAEEITSLLFSHGVGISNHAFPIANLPTVPRGVIVCIKGPSDPMFPFAKDVVSALRADKSLVGKFTVWPRLDQGTVVIVVGENTKGPAFFESRRITILK